MPTADATLLPPAFTSASPAETAEDRKSARHLEDVGVHAVLGAMIEQKRRASQPSFAAIDLPPSSEITETSDASGADETNDSEAPESAEPRRKPTRSEVFLKAR